MFRENNSTYMSEQNVDHTMAINPSFATKGMVASIFYGGAGEGPASSRLKVELEKL